MLTLENISKLCQAEIREAIDQNIDRSPQSIALDKRLSEAALIATQVKYLQRAKSKLPSYYEARAIFPPISFEQSSSEAVAGVKSIKGDSLLDLTCGLGVDSFHFSKSFRRVVTIERSEELAAVARENFRRLGVDNIEVINSSAEEYLSQCTNHFDWIYVDPDRRSAEGKKMVRLEDCSPNILSLMDTIERLSDRLMIKNSPLFDVDEAFRLFSPARVEVLSLGDECKEVLVSTREGKDVLISTALGRGEIIVDRSDVNNFLCTDVFDLTRYQWLITPDVALQKARLVAHSMRGVADVWSENGYGFAASLPNGVLGRVEEIEKIVDYNPKTLKRELSGERIEILKRDFPLSVAQIVKQLKIKEGGRKRVAFTKIGTRQIVIFLR